MYVENDDYIVKYCLNHYVKEMCVSAHRARASFEYIQ
jgi:hypothetical protein